VKNPHLQAVTCLSCGHVQATASPFAAACTACGSQWLDASYDYEALGAGWGQQVAGRALDLWRYAELLPIVTTYHELRMGEGWTPLARLIPYERLYNHAPIFVKDERAQPTNSFKDRQAALSVMAMKQVGIGECVLASTGNAAVAYAAYCARAGIKLWLFLTSLVPAEKMREAALYGAEVVKVSGTYDETKQVAAEFAQRRNIHLDRGAKSIPGKESMKTLAFEIAEQLARVLPPPPAGRWRAPDWYIQAVSGGIGPLGVYKGFTELHRMGLIDRVPKLGIIQAAGCAPMVEAFRANAEQAKPVVPKTLITVLATGDPGYSYVLLRQAIQRHGGTMIAIEDGETFSAMRQAASKGGLSVEPATAVAFAGLTKLLQDGTIAPDECVVVNCSGHTFPAESHILGDQYDRYILDLQIKGTASTRDEEGLGAALENLHEQVTTIVVVDDNPNDRRLIRRLLQSYKQYRIYEARDGREGLVVIRDRQPDLVISDLTMPDMDGFSLLEQLKQDSATAHIPVLVASAKSLTAADRQRLERFSEEIFTKDGMDTRQLVERVVKTLGHEPISVIMPPATTPNAPSAAQEPATPDENSAQVPPTINDAQQTIVIIDDNPLDLRLAKRIIHSGGAYNLIEAVNGREGLKAIYNYHPDMIVLDLLLPDMDGFTILDTLQRDPNLRDIPIIIYSAHDLTPEERQRAETQIRAIVTKSNMNRQRFLQAIREGLQPFPRR